MTTPALPQPPPRPSHLWRQLSSAGRIAAAEAFWSDSEAGLDQLEAIAVIARHLKFRPKSVRALPAANKVRHLAAMRLLPESVALRALVSYHLRDRRAMMGAFLDRLGVSHDNGVIAVEGLEPPPADRLDDAVRELRAAYPEPEVTLYFSTLLAQDPVTWAGLARAVHETHSQ